MMGSQWCIVGASIVDNHHLTARVGWLNLNLQSVEALRWNKLGRDEDDDDDQDDTSYPWLYVDCLW